MPNFHHPSRRVQGAPRGVWMAVGAACFLLVYVCLALAVSMSQLRAAAHRDVKEPLPATILTHYRPVEPPRRDAQAPAAQPESESEAAEPSSPATAPADPPPPAAPDAALP